MRNAVVRASLVAVVSALALGTAVAQTPIKFQLDWRFEGPAALFLYPADKGYFKQTGLDVTIDAGNGSSATVARVASGTYDMGFADMAALMEYHANHPDAPNKPVAVMMVYHNTPAAVLALKKSGIAKPADLKGKRLGAPVFDAGRRAFTLFDRANGVGKVEWVTMDPALRESMLVRGDVDAITGFSFTSLLNLEARGFTESEVVVMPFVDHGVPLYGNAIIASPQLVRERPAVVRAFLRAFVRGAKEVMAKPADGIEALRKRAPLSNAVLETRRLHLALEATIFQSEAVREGFGQVDPERLAVMAALISDGYHTSTRVEPQKVWNGSLLPSAAELNVLPTTR